MDRQQYRDRDRGDRGDRGDKGGFGKRERPQRKRVCRFCADGNLKIDYKDVRALSYYVTERCKIVPRRVTSNCCFHQRQITEAVKKARILALIPFTATQMKW